MISINENKMIEIKEAINDKLGFMDPTSLSQSLKIIIDDTLYNSKGPS